ETAPSHIATLLYGLRYFLGRVFGWDREPMRPEDSFLERLSERDRRDSEITPGTLDGQFWVLYQFPGEALRETRNRTVHGFICTALVSCPNRYRLYRSEEHTSELQSPDNLVCPPVLENKILAAK